MNDKLTLNEIKANLSSDKAKTDAFNSKKGTESLTSDVSKIEDWQAQHVIIVGMSTLLFGVIVVLVMAWLISKGHKAVEITRTLALPVIVIAAVFLVVVGYSQGQIQPVIALLGTLAGFILGSNKQDQKETDQS